MNPDLYRRALAGEPLRIDLSARARWRLSGGDRVRYLNGQITNDATRLGEGQAMYAAVCTIKGRLEGDLFVARHGEAFFLDADPALRESLGARLDKYLVADDALFEDLTESWSLAHVLGASAPAGLPADGFAIVHARFGLPGYDIWTPEPGFIPALDLLDSATLEVITLEHGLPRWGSELADTTLPPEAGPAMEAAISYTKGCYVGQEIIARLKSVGQTPRTLVFLASETEQTPTAGESLTAEGEPAGRITRTGFSPRLGRGVALAYVPRARAGLGTKLAAGEVAMTVTAPLTQLPA